MKIIIAGAGDVGTHLAKLLSNEDQDVILLDSDQARLDIIDNNYNLMTYNGSTSSIKALREVGVENADLFIAVTPYETRNLAACSIADKLGARKTVARVDSQEFINKENGYILREMGVDYMIYPERLAADEISTALHHNWARYWGELHDASLLLIGVKVRQDAPICGCTLKSLPVKGHVFHIAAIKRHHETIIPGGDDTLEAGDIVYFITTEPYTEVVRNLCGKTSYHIKRVMIMGGSRIAVRFCLQNHDKFNIKIIDCNRERCEELATLLPQVEIAVGDARDIDVLRDNNISEYDAFLALTDSSETNILSCLTAKEFGVPKTVADVENIQFLDQAESLNIGTTVNKKLLASSRIFKILLDADEHNAKTLALADAEVAELPVKEKAKITRGPVKSLNLPHGMTLAALVRDGVCSLIDGNSQIEAGDNVVVFCLMGSISKIEKWFN